MSEYTECSGTAPGPRPAIRFLVETALREVVNARRKACPRTRSERVAHLADALMSDSETPHHAAVASLISHGISREEILQGYVPAAARHLGRLWLSDRASFVDVTIGAARLQRMFRSWDERPAGSEEHAVLMVVPRFEHHALGAFVAADGLRRAGLSVVMGVSLDAAGVADLIFRHRFAMIGMTLATPNSVEKAKELVEFMHTKLECVPPIVIGGRAVEVVPDAARRAGADHAARSAQEAIEKCGLATLAASPALASMC